MIRWLLRAVAPMLEYAPARQESADSKRSFVCLAIDNWNIDGILSPVFPQWLPFGAELKSYSNGKLLCFFPIFCSKIWPQPLIVFKFGGYEVQFQISENICSRPTWGLKSKQKSWSVCKNQKMSKMAKFFVFCSFSDFYTLINLVLILILDPMLVESKCSLRSEAHLL